MTHKNMDSTWRNQCMSLANREVHPAKFLAKGESDILPKMANRRFELILGSVDHCSICTIGQKEKLRGYEVHIVN